MARKSENKDINKDVVISSRVRLARNSRKFPFPPRLDIETAIRLVDICQKTISQSSEYDTEKLNYIDLTKLNPLEKECLVEKHLISPEFASKKEVTGLILSSNETTSIMINEEDHLRIQAIYPGLQLESSWKDCNHFDDIIEKNLDYAFDEDFGYLTSCPTNVGTGLRASVMVHLPALAILGYVKAVLDAVTKLGITVRGLYGEGSDFMGNMYQISNQVTLGLSEEEIIEKITNIARRVIEQEKIARQQLLKSKIQLEDRLFRAFGIFSNARIMTSNECMKILSDVRLGVDLGIITEIKTEDINNLMIVTQPANLQKAYGKILSPEERDVKRAELIRGILNKG